MKLCLTTLDTLEANLALDEALLLDAEANPEQAVLRFWEWPNWAVVLGAGGLIQKDVNLTACERDNVPVLRRSSGGGTVLLGSGCVLFSLILPYSLHPVLNEISPSYQYILGKIQAALSPLTPDLQQAGISDLVFRNRKFSGNSQQRKRHHLLHHGTILYNFPLDFVGTYLTIPVRQPDYRENRHHDAFLTNLSAKREAILAALQKQWPIKETLDELPTALVSRLVAEKYSQREWTFRR